MSFKYARRSGMVGLATAEAPDQDTISARGRHPCLAPPNNTYLHLYSIFLRQPLTNVSAERVSKAGPA